ncbi:hypothetical protein Q5H92_09730 [Hymenobacter sp. M29]|uniref:Uncharacterized protein n=1 Tax=Hymenobacter mellowenesis TaxID=3063995 RepID=A0ABT9ABV0_9BACT|nr:hypothetical protein [Hymenobacter sp. M29]MDO7846635.1 hypothetical protein [Hymenobacter sp. M29]
MKNSPVFALLLALPLAAAAQTTPTTSPAKTTTTTTPAPAGTQQQTEVVEELDPATGKVIRRTTRTVNVPVGTTPSTTTTTRPSTTTTASDLPASPASDAQVTAFLRKKTTVSTLSTSGLLDAYSRLMDRVHNDRSGWKPADWALAANVMSALNARYDQLRSSFSFDDKVNIRAQQAEFQTLRTARQLSDQVSDKL